jgi:hypothetical protein
MKAEIVIPLLVAAIASVFFYSAVGQDFARDPAVHGGASSASASSP